MEKLVVFAPPRSRLKFSYIALHGFEVKDIFKVDKTGLFFNLVSRRTYDVYVKNKKSIGETNVIKAKFRVVL